MEQLFDRYCRLLQEKLDAIKEIQKLTKKQYDCLRKNDIDALVDNLKERGLLMDKVDSLTEEISQFAQSDYDNNDTIKMKAQIEELLSEVRNDNKELKEKVVVLKDQCADEIKSLNMNEKSFKAYENVDFNYGSVYFDKLK